MYPIAQGMAVRVISSSLPASIRDHVRTFLSLPEFTLEELRQYLCGQSQDRWVCLSGSSFAYVVS